MLTVQNLSKSHGAETILQDISFIVNAGERVALIGPNGSGKSTILRIITQQTAPDHGHISTSPHTRIGYLPQGLELDNDLTCAEIVRQGLHEWDDARKKIEELSLALGKASPESQPQILETYGDALELFESLGGYGLEHRIDEVLAGLGMDHIELDRLIINLSGGQRTRLGLAQILVANPNLLLLDEPTNHLDIQALEWLETFLRNFQGAALIVSHDRTFLNATVTRILAIDPDTHTLQSYAGNYSDYAGTVMAERDKQWDAWNEQNLTIQRMETDIHRTKHQALSVELTTTSRQPSIRRYAKKVARKAASREKKLKRYLDSEERVDKPKKGWQLKLEFENMPRSGQMVLTLENLSHQYPNQSLLFFNVSQSIYHGERVVLLGPNGCGKSTLFEIIVGQLTPSEGTVRPGSGVVVGYMPQDQDTLDPELNALTTLQSVAPMSETDARNFLHYFLFAGDSVFTEVQYLSYGERARLLLAKLVSSGANFLILDEPINHLDIPSRENFESALENFPGAILVAAHDRTFINRFATRFWTISEQDIQISLP